jgi:hypothetical protein
MAMVAESPVTYGRLITLKAVFVGMGEPSSFWMIHELPLKWTPIG